MLGSENGFLKLYLWGKNRDLLSQSSRKHLLCLTPWENGGGDPAKDEETTRFLPRFTMTI
jgi:hypothetical protein